MENLGAEKPKHRLQRSPTGAKQQLRHWVLYHNPSTMGCEFFDLPGFDCVTNKRVRDLLGDVVWLIGRPSTSKKQFYLDSRFRVSRVETGQFGGFRVRLGADDGFLFFPPMRVDTEPWFRLLYVQTARFSTGFQPVYDLTILDGLDAAYLAARDIQKAE